MNVAVACLRPNTSNTDGYFHNPGSLSNKREHLTMGNASDMTSLEALIHSASHDRLVTSLSVPGEGHCPTPESAGTAQHIQKVTSSYLLQMSKEGGLVGHSGY